MSIFHKNVCLYCQKEIDEPLGWSDIFQANKTILLCPTCRSGLESIHDPVCPNCGRPMEEKLEKLCEDCKEWQKDLNYASVLSCNISLYRYNDFTKELIARFKYRGDYILAKIFTHELSKRLPQADYIVPIPLSAERLQERGFNQAEAIGLVAGLKLTNGLVRIHTEKQAKKSRYERLHTKQVFELHPDAPDWTGKSILLLDDIYTTGTTMRHAAYILKTSGAKDIFSMTIAR